MTANDEDRRNVEPPAEVTEEARAFIPEDAPEIVGMDVEKQAIGLTMKTGYPTIMIGHTGTAKTTLLRRVHQECGWPYRGISGRESVEVDNLLGKWRIGEDRKMEYHLGVLPFCMKHGIAVGVQEINYVAPEVLVLLHEYVDEGFITLDELAPDDEDFVITPHPNFRLYGTMNPPELYPGARQLSPALLRRCMVRTVESLERDQEIEVLTAQVDGIEHHDASQMVDVARSIRGSFDDGKVQFYCSTADLVMWGRLAQEIDVIVASELAITGKAPEQDQAFVKGRIRLSFNPQTPTVPGTADGEPPF